MFPICMIQLHTSSHSFCLYWHGLRLPAICNCACITSKPNLKSEMYPSLHFGFLYLRNLTKVFPVKIRLIFFTLKTVKFKDLWPSNFCIVSQILPSETAEVHQCLIKFPPPFFSYKDILVYRSHDLGELNCNS